MAFGFQSCSGVVARTRPLPDAPSDALPKAFKNRNLKAISLPRSYKVLAPETKAKLEIQP